MGKRSLTEILNAAAEGDDRAADRMAPVLYDELRRLASRHMRRERSDHTLQPTALAHEAYLRLFDDSAIRWNSRVHFLAIASRVIRRVLVDHARTKGAAKRGGDRDRVELTIIESPETRDGAINLLDLDEALIELGKLHDRQRQIVEMRYFSGMTIEEVAESLGVGVTTVKAEWRMARAWLAERLDR